MFRNLTALHSLWLDGNNLTFLHPGTFSALSSLRELDLRGNSRLTSLHANAFRGLLNLASLDLSFCNIFEIHPLVFSHLPSLQVLDLGSNNMRYIPEAFRSLPSIARLSLASNHIEAIGRDSLKGLKTLYELNLRKNPIWIIQRDAFTALSGLGVLNLGHNLLSDLPNQLFKGLIRLKTLHLEANRITRVGCSLNSLPCLRTLYLNNNCIAYIAGSAFSHLKQLHFLHLSKNNLSYLPSPVFSGTAKLRYVFLSHNPWNCDCKMLWFPQWRATYKGLVEGLHCAFPALHNRTLLHFVGHEKLPGCLSSSGPAEDSACTDSNASTASRLPAVSDTLLLVVLAWCRWHWARM
ncbi:nyctalopin-like [Alligator sinensis]|uniref:Nyctalopin-like n=1 Tax=Alligator sinensis TaxID=38654 RepID=A0A1U7RJI4_ALLSI|nr:nyctalopin-like [Alligator sinensis]